MKLSTKSRYGTRLMLELAEHFQDGPVHLTTVARRSGDFREISGTDHHSSEKSQLCEECARSEGWSYPGEATRRDNDRRNRGLAGRWRQSGQSARTTPWLCERSSSLCDPLYLAGSGASHVRQIEFHYPGRCDERGRSLLFGIRSLICTAKL